MTYAVSELFYTLQGEGTKVGTPAVFIRFAGCNLWNGRASSRSSAICRWCDVPPLEDHVPGIAGRTTFAGMFGPGGGHYDPVELAETARGKGPGSSLVVLTGGEPMLQVKPDLTDALRDMGFVVALETNGTIPVPNGLVDFVTVSPKAGTELVQRSGDDLRLVYPQVGPDGRVLDPELVLVRAPWFKRYLVSPMDPIPHGDDYEHRWRDNIRVATEYVLSHPTWSLSLQVHKTLGLP